MSRRLATFEVATRVGLPLGAALMVAATGLRISGRAPVMASAPLSVVPWMVPAAGALSIVASARGQRTSAAMLAASSGVLFATVAPRFRGRRQPDPGPDARRLTVMSINVFQGGADPQVLLSHVRARHPDVLAIQEQSPGYVRQLVEAGIEEALPYRVAGDGRRVNDPALFTKHPLEPLGIDLPGVWVGALMRLPGGTGVPLISGHPLPPASPSTERHWAATLGALPDPTGAMAGGLVAGDFNATLDHPAFRALLRRGWRDAGAEAGQGGRSTWTGNLGLLRMVIDHVLVPPGAAVRSFRVDRLTGSDHRIVTLSVDVPASIVGDEFGAGIPQP